MRIPRDLERRILATPGVTVRRHAAHPKRKPHAVPCLVSVGGVTSLRIRIPLRLPSLPNCTGLHWRQLGKLKREQKETVAYYLKDAIVPPLPATVTLTRVGPRKLDGDNLAGAFKAVRDSVADAYGVDDGDERYTWICKQRLGKEYAVEIEIDSRG